MFIWDQHVHSKYSMDAFIGMAEMALAEAEAGMDGVCFTDHCDLERYDTGLEDSGCWRPAELFGDFEEAKKRVGDKIALRLGLELGSGTTTRQGG
jgi:histidinol-phosphatase (PHP family)